MSTDIAVCHLDQEPVMLRTVRLSILFVCLVFVASCSDAQDALSPEAHTASSIARVPVGTMAASHDHEYDDDVLPNDLSDIARFRGASARHGAKTVSAVIGAQGGTLRLDDFEVVVPAGAVSSPTRFSIKTFPENSRKKHAVASFLPHRTFDKPLTVRVPLNATRSAGDYGAHVMWWNGHEWVALPTSATSDGRLETHTSHFSMYGTQFRGFTLVGG